MSYEVISAADACIIFANKREAGACSWLQSQARMFPCLLLSLTPLAAASPLPDPSVNIPSFTSGFLPLKYPSYLRNKVGKREDSERSASYADSWHFGKKRSPWTGAWANIVWRPEGVGLKTEEKRDPQPSLRKHYRIILIDCYLQNIYYFFILEVEASHILLPIFLYWSNIEYFLFSPNSAPRQKLMIL